MHTHLPYNLPSYDCRKPFEKQVPGFLWHTGYGKRDEEEEEEEKKESH